MNKKSFFFDGADKAKNVWRGAGKGSRSAGRSTYCVYSVPYTTAEETLIYIALREVSQIYSKS